MNFDVNMVEEVRRLDKLHSRQRRFLRLVPIIAILGLVIVFWLVPASISWLDNLQLEFPSFEAQATKTERPSQSRSTATENQANLMVSPPAMSSPTIPVTPTAISTLDAVAATHESQAWAVQNAIRGNR